MIERGGATTPTSSVLNARAMPHLILLSIGPVQRFIAASRRCRDLWFSSWMLSELSKAAARRFAERWGEAGLIFPGVAADDLRPSTRTSVANRLLLKVSDAIEPAEVAAAAEEGVRGRLREMQDLAFETLPAEFFDRVRATAQVEALPEIVWASVRYDESLDDAYTRARARVEAALAARKHTAIWQQAPWSAPVPKSSLDGERESVIAEAAFERFDEPALHKEFGVRVGERLCGVGFLKRRGIREIGFLPDGRPCHVRDQHYISTPHIAAWPMLARLKDSRLLDQARAAWGGFLKAMKAASPDVDLEPSIFVDEVFHRPHPVTGRHDGQLLFEGRLEERYLALPLDARRTAARAARGALQRFYRALELPSPLPYYAIVVGDGDRMGRAIEGLRSAEHQRAFSQALADFARRARTVVEVDHKGELIYAGGDDVMAFVPMHRLLGCVDGLRKAFSTALASFSTSEDELSLSIGVGISHFMVPMGSALETARAAERRAKESRNALAIALDKRSGDLVTVCGRWDRIERDLDAFAAMHLRDTVPDGAAYELLELTSLLDREPAERATLERVVASEALRILRRKRPPSDTGERADLVALERRLCSSEADRLTVRALAEQLIIARILAEARRVAHIDFLSHAEELHDSVAH